MRTIAGHESLEVAYARARTLSALLTRLAELIPEMASNLWDNQGNLYQDVPIFVNGRNPRLTGTGINMPLEPEDVITLFSPIASGRMNVEGMRTAAINDEQEHNE
jgi:molybdopterin converting factor small subunit